jgi:hypothetical protein
MIGIPDYVLEASFQDENVRNWVLLTMYYDLMSYLAQSYARSISVGLTLVQARTTVVAQLVNLLAVADLAPLGEIIKIMTVIAKKLMPAPPPPLQLDNSLHSAPSLAALS